MKVTVLPSSVVPLLKRKTGLYLPSPPPCTTRTFAETARYIYGQCNQQNMRDTPQKGGALSSSSSSPSSSSSSSPSKKKRKSFSSDPEIISVWGYAGMEYVFHPSDLSNHGGQGGQGARIYVGLRVNGEDVLPWGIDYMEDKDEDASKEKAKDASKEKAKNASKDVTKDTSKDATKDATKDVTKDVTKDATKDATNDTPKDVTKGKTNDNTKRAENIDNVSNAPRRTNTSYAKEWTALKKRTNFPGNRCSWNTVHHLPPPANISAEVDSTTRTKIKQLIEEACAVTTKKTAAGMALFKATLATISCLDLGPDFKDAVGTVEALICDNELTKAKLYLKCIEVQCEEEGGKAEEGEKGKKDEAKASTTKHSKPTTDLPSSGNTLQHSIGVLKQMYNDTFGRNPKGIKASDRKWLTNEINSAASTTKTSATKASTTRASTTRASSTKIDLDSSASDSDSSSSDSDSSIEKPAPSTAKKTKQPVATTTPKSTTTSSTTPSSKRTPLLQPKSTGNKNSLWKADIVSAESKGLHTLFSSNARSPKSSQNDDSSRVTVPSPSLPNNTTTVWRNSKVVEIVDGKVRVEGEKGYVNGELRVVGNKGKKGKKGNKGKKGKKGKMEKRGKGKRIHFGESNK
ncbi:hypothetical protein TrRE_jg2773 [Triparma retinervis]|uniref:Uncharacterized protein n=1 Tax=Triparma retinervis TaxID=2557542 RepID=A0A9W6ZA34_9STRA|nr:hypothetical protein TrRE_jg2773 [Triparma retinervis]